jgi:hypothetical protein
MKVADLLAMRKHRGQWPFLLGNRYSASDSEFTVSPDLMLRDPYRFRVTGQFAGVGATIVTVCVRLGLGVWVEAYVVAGAFVVAAGSVPIIVEVNKTSGVVDLSPLLLATPLVLVVSIGVASRVWITWRARSFVNSVRAILSEPALRDTKPSLAPK